MGQNSGSRTMVPPSPLPPFQTGGIASLLPSKDSRWRNWWIRGVFTFVMVGGFCVVIYLGPFYLSLLVSWNNVS